ncbi:polysaccharide deacetylase family protein [Leptospira sp. GIMC2001]|uniref:polysaccharide deacetylase family protein n=1 Tax=Leptospira sp. GIMC2001 TaxID=1513297 RepID=UPI00234AA882|nr:polysaccharide deacetylase family protein [Leptospira sp. GIMC2001]WCL49739.1 polysaccharide deacetylase family protein [Leptospira sp. GIMC2001]
MRSLIPFIILSLCIFSNLFAKENKSGSNPKNNLKNPIIKIPESEKIFYSGRSKFDSTKPDELGLIPIITYHKILPKENLMKRSAQNFRKDLDFLKKHNFYFIRAQDLYEGWIDIPQGKIPVLLTFDDSHISQFNFLNNGKIDPDSAIGILENFKSQYPTYPLTAVFFVTPCQGKPNNLFGQEQLTKKKLNYLISHGYEIENHSCAHPDYQKTPIDSITSDLSLSQKKIREFLPGYNYNFLATPYGGYPNKKYWNQLETFPNTFTKNKNSNKISTKAYNHNLIFDYSNRLSLSPFSSAFRTNRVRRIHGHEVSLQELKNSIVNKEIRLFVSDGDPRTVTIRKNESNLLKFDKTKKLVIAPNRLNTYKLIEHSK